MKKKKSGSLIVISGPSGVGKDTICNELVRKHNEICLSISMTTRERRGNEVDGENYFFVTKDDFIKNIENNNINNNNKICRLAFNENAGAPVIFPECYYNELLTLPQGKGGGFIAKKHPAQVVLVPAQDEYELYDIDTPDDLIRLSRYLR